MATQRYSVTPHPIETLLTWIKSGEIAIPEIQRPFVWNATKVRNLLDSLYRGYPVGYLIAWRNPTIRLKDGTLSAGKRILIDGQQRVTALMAALLGQEVLTKHYRTVRIRIAFHPIEKRFEVSNPAIRKDAAWIPDIAAIFAPEARLFELAERYVTANPGTDRGELFHTLENLRKILNNHVGIIELAEDLDIETVTEIFIRVNSAGVPLSQADFAMSKIAANTSYGGNQLRKAIDYFCHLAVAPEFHRRIERNDPTFASSTFWPKMTWLKDVNDDIYDPSYTDMLRVAFTSEFGRGKLEDLVALLSGRNFETKQYEEVIAEDAFSRLKQGVMSFMNETHFKRLVMIVRSAGFIHRDLISGQNAVNFAYILYLRARAEGVPAADIERIVRRWYVMSLLTGRYSGNPETRFDLDMRQIAARGVAAHTQAVIGAEISDSFWSTLLPQSMETSSINSPYFRVFQAAQVKLQDKGFLSRDITVQDLILNRSDVHHLFPRRHLKGLGLSRGRYNQIANYALAQSEVNIAIGAKPPAVFAALQTVSAFEFDVVVIEKRKAPPDVRSPTELYSRFGAELLDHVFRRYHEAEQDVILITDTIPIAKHRRAIEKTFKQYVRRRLEGRRFAIHHHSSVAHPALQAADYCTWAVYRKYQRGDVRSYDLIRGFVRTELEVFAGEGAQRTDA